MAMKTKQLPDVVPPVEEESNEPYGAQVLRRLHKDASDLLGEYDSLLGPLEHEDVKAYLKTYLEGKEKHLSAVEKMFGKHYKDLPGLDGAVEDEEEGEFEELEDEKDLTSDEAEEIADDLVEETEDVEEKDMDTMDDAAIDADSDEEEEPTPEEAIEGMGKKAFDSATANVNKSNRKKLEKSAKANKGLCSGCNEDPCTCKALRNGKKHLGERKVIEWVPGKWWVVEETGKDGSLSPLYEGKGSTSAARKKDAESWLSSGTKDLTTDELEEVQDDLADETADVESKGLDDDEKKKVGEALDFLKAIGDDGSEFGDDHRMQSFHFHKVLGEIGDRTWDDEEAEGLSADQVA